MKRIIAALFCIMFIFTACSAKTTTFDEAAANAYVGAGEMMVITTLVKSNGFFVEDVFVGGHLPYDAETKAETENGTYALVTSEQFASYEEFEKKIRSTYTAEVCEELLASDKYANIDGKLYFNLKYENDEKYALDWSEATAEATINADGLYEITAKVKGTAGVSKKVSLLAANENGNIRLMDIYS